MLNDRNMCKIKVKKFLFKVSWRFEVMEENLRGRIPLPPPAPWIGLKKEFISMSLNIPKEATDRVHRIGRKYGVDEVDKDGVVTGVSLKQQVIVRFSTWSHRTQVYQARKGSKGPIIFSVCGGSEF